MVDGIAQVLAVYDLTELRERPELLEVPRAGAQRLEGRPMKRCVVLAKTT
jgi:hypothetical protein